MTILAVLICAKAVCGWTEVDRFETRERCVAVMQGQEAGYKVKGSFAAVRCSEDKTKG